MKDKIVPFNIVASNAILRYFRKIPIFKLELGTALRHVTGKPGDVPKIKIKDIFVKEYERINNSLIHKYGSIGIITFYEDQTLNRNEFHIYKNDQVYEIDVTPEDFSTDANKYLSEILQMIDNKKTNDNINDVSYTNAPDEAEIPDKKLPRDQYIEALLKRREILNKIQNQNL